MTMMPTIPVGEFDPQGIAEQMYGNEEVRNPLFEHAWKAYPGFNTDQLFEAADDILGGFRDEYADFIESMPQDKWLEIEGYLYESIMAGLS